MLRNYIDSDQFSFVFSPIETSSRWTIRSCCLLRLCFEVQNRPKCL